MADAKIQVKDLADLEFQKNDAERKKILFVEAIFVMLFTIFSDLVEFFVPLFSWIITLPISIATMMWAYLRGLHGRFELKWAAGKIVDYMTSGIFPIATIVMLVLIPLNNHVSKDILKRIESVLDRVK